MADVKDLVTAFDPSVPIERAWTPPAAWYTSPALYEVEREGVFGPSWQPLVRREELTEPGAFASGCWLGEPWLVVRGDDARLRAFSNVCRHKGREVVTGAGRTAELVCGYHAWQYDLRGRLRKAPRMAGVEELDRGAMSLPPLSLEPWGPWAFVSRAPRGPFGPGLAALAEELDRSGWRALTLVAERSYTLRCNWKVYVDNYLDGGYHVPHMHPSLAAQLDMASYRTELYDRYAIQTAEPASAGAEGPDGLRRIGPRAIYAWIYPNLMLNRYGPCLDTNHVVPLGPDRCRVDYQFYFLRDPDAPGHASDAFVERSIAQSERTQQEDAAICESVQRGLGSSSYDRGRYAPGVEQAEHLFHRLLAADLRAAG